MSQNFFQIFRSGHVHLKTDKVDLKKRPPWKKKILHFFSINLSSRHEKSCQMLQRLFWLFQCSKNPLWYLNSLIFLIWETKITKVSIHLHKNFSLFKRLWMSLLPLSSSKSHLLSAETRFWKLGGLLWNIFKFKYWESVQCKSIFYTILSSLFGRKEIARVEQYFLIPLLSDHKPIMHGTLKI